LKAGNVQFAESTVRNRHKPLRAGLLAFVWMLPAVWCAAHALGHEIEPSPQSDLALSASAGVPVTSCNHDHAHSHPEAPPVLSAEGAKKLGEPVLFAAAVEFEGPDATLCSPEDSALGYAAHQVVAGSGPRAPPIS
jgi:hypothetical protein